MPYLAIPAIQFLKAIVLFEIITLEFVRFQVLSRKTTLISVPKMLYWAKIEANLKKLLSYLQSAPSNSTNVKFHVKQSNFKSRTKNALFEYF